MSLSKVMNNWRQIFSQTLVDEDVRVFNIPISNNIQETLIKHKAKRLGIDLVGRVVQGNNITLQFRCTEDQIRQLKS